MTKSQLTIVERVATDHGPRPTPTWAQVHDVEQVRGMIGIVAVDLVRICPASRELNIALNKLDEAVQWAREAIERHGTTGPSTEYTV